MGVEHADVAPRQQGDRRDHRRDAASPERPQRLSDGVGRLDRAQPAEQDERIAIGDGEFHVRRAGETLHPEIESLERLRKLQREIGSDVFAAQYQQLPVPPGGGIVEADLVDQLFNSSEKRLARLLLLLANFGKEGQPEPVIAKISQQTLAEMIGTTRARVSFFMNRFRQLGFIDYNGGIAVHSSLLNVVLHDQPQIKI